MPIFPRRAMLAVLLVNLSLSIADIVRAQPQPIPEDERLLPYAEPGQLIDIGGRRINLLCSGSGGPAVILMAGLFSWSPVWYKTQPVIAETTRVCTFDRASYGFSDPAPRPQIVSDVVDDLHAALKAAAIPAPYVLVGHSLGGIEARLYAQRWPGEVAGMVLVDTSPANEGLLDETQPGFDEAIDREHWASDKLRCALLASNGPLKPSAPEFKSCSVPLPGDTPAAFRRIWPTFFTAEHAVAQVSLMSSLYTHRYESVDHRRLGAMPLIVLSPEDSWGDGTRATERFWQTYKPVWYAKHEALAKLSSRGVHRIINGSGHEIQLDKPQAVVDAVDEVLRQIRSGPTPQNRLRAVAN